PQVTTENVNLNFSVSATDAESTPTVSTSALPSGATFTPSAGGGTFDWTPDFLQSGSYDVTFYATDDSAAVDSEVVTITVNEAGNRAPVLAAIGPRNTQESVNLNFVVSATDIESIPTVTTSTLPSGATFTPSAGGGTFDWTPGFTDAGVYSVTFYATDDSAAVDSEVVAITVTDAGNQAPVLAAIGPRSTNENVNLNFSVSSTDAESTPTVTTSALPGGASFTPNGSGGGTFDWTPTFVQAGVYQVTFTTTDASLAVDSEVVTITVNEVGNQAPVLAAIGAKSTNENTLLSFAVSSTDAESIPNVTTSALPSGASFTPNGAGGGLFQWTPSYTQSGVYIVSFFATDDSGSVDGEAVTITVNEVGNQAPVLAAIGPRVTPESVNLNFAVSATDAESIPTVTTSALPSGASFTPSAGGGTFDWTPNFLQVGAYSVTFYATDDSATVDREVVSITVTEAGNQVPVLAAIGPQVTTENVNLNFSVSATDIESVPTVTTSALPAGATFTPSAGGGTFDWTPSFLQSGVYGVTFYATDDSAAVDSEVVTITVNDGGNQSPVLAAIGPRATNENVNLNFSVSATDIESVPTVTTSVLPAGAIFTPSVGGGTFDWTPDFTQSGVYSVTFYAIDDSAAVDSEVVSITINEIGNQAPVLAAIGAKATSENVNLSFAVSATDEESIPDVTTSALPAGASFTPSPGGGSFDWTPDFTQSGVYSITFYATDDSAAVDSEVVSITVSESGNQLPILASIGAKSTNETVNLNFGVSATDAESIPDLTTSVLPGGANFTDNNNGTGVFDWTPSYTDSGTYTVTFYATDSDLAVDSETVTITVFNVNRAPVANAGSDQLGALNGALVQLNGAGSFDADTDPLAYSWQQLTGPAVTLSNQFAQSPTFTAPSPGDYRFALTVNDGSLFSAPDTVYIQVINAAPPRAITNLSIQITADSLRLTWGAITLDTNGVPTTIDRYVIYRGTSAYFTPTAFDSIGAAAGGATSFRDADIGGANVVGDTTTNYFYVVQVVDYVGGRSALSNRVGEFDYQLVTTATTNFNLIGVPFANSGITSADDLIARIGVANVLTVNNYVPASQSYESRFAAGFGVNFAVNVGGVYQVNAAVDTIFSVAGAVPAPGAVSYTTVKTATTSFSFLMIPFDREGDFAVAQDVLNSIPGVLNTLNKFVAGPQSYQSRFAAGFGTNFPVRAGKPYQANAASVGVFPAP
ncbi:MAG TPA: putative Ig domain-containing protein, partial [candidate division Zixibacteria bacterium]|nr:putative Ig domain-containing protein [candidate division Zixibacteria bacterium]